MSNISYFVSVEPHDPISEIIAKSSDCDIASHAGFYRKSDGWTYSAMLIGGVAWRPPNPKAVVFPLRDIRGEDVPALALEAALTQQGDKYDWLNILGIILDKDWQTSGRFICDKLLFWSLQKANYPLLNHDLIPIDLLRPRDILLSPWVAK